MKDAPWPNLSEGVSASTLECGQVGKMKTLFDILKKDQNGSFQWVEEVNDLETARLRLQQLSAQSPDEFIVFRHMDLRVVAPSRTGSP